LKQNGRIKATRKGGRVLLRLLIVGCLGVVVIFILIVRGAGRPVQAAASTTLAQRATAPHGSTATGGKIDHLGFLKGTCKESSHTAEGPIEADLTERQSRFFCDTAVITFYDNHNSHLMINFLDKKAAHGRILGFAGQLESDRITMPADHVYFEPGKATIVSDGGCTIGFDEVQITGIVCIIKADEGGRRTVAVVEFEAAPTQ
jgi:hypothetical protein